MKGQGLADVRLDVRHSCGLGVCDEGRGTEVLGDAFP